MSDDEKELEESEGTLNPDLLEEGLGDDVVEVDDDELNEDGDVSLEKMADDEDGEWAEGDKYDDVDTL